MLSEQIDKIVKARNSAKTIFENRIANAKLWQSYVNGLLAICNQKRKTWNLVIQDSNAEKEAKILETHLNEFKKHVDKLLGVTEDGNSLKAALERACREYVNLGIIGPWRIGKSQIVQQLTGLDTWLIPTDAADNCTACPIHVINGEYKGEESVAVISVYSITEMCKNINEYIEHCGMSGRIPMLYASTSSEFLSQCQERSLLLESITNPGGAVEGFFDKMKDYLDNAQAYYKILSSNGEIDLRSIFDESILQYVKTEEGNIVLTKINKQVIKKVYRPFVSYFALPGASNHTFTCLASKSVTIYYNFRFLNEDIGKLRLMDTPGIGECKLNVSEGLSYALRYSLDIAVATASARPNINDLQQIRDFHDILKRETDGREPQNWLYYMFNVYSTDKQMTSSILKNRHKFIKDDLKKNIEGGHGIELTESHYADIDALINKGIDCPEDENIPLETVRNETVNLSAFYDTILHEMVDSIENVDRVFYSKAKKQYDEVALEFDALLKEIQLLPIISYDNQVIDFITGQMSKLYDAIKHLHLDLKLYDKDDITQQSTERTLSRKIKDYCSPIDYGKEIAKILKVEKPISTKDFDAFFECIKSRLSYYITEDNWNENQDFDQYIKIKRDLIKQIEINVLSQYDKAQAERNLECEKNKILEVYHTTGKIGDIVDCTSEAWCEKFIKLLEGDGQYSELLKVFKEFLEYKLKIEEILQQNIKTLRIKKQHRDQFIYDDDDMTPFDGYDKALKAFAYSLYNIEIAIKKELAGTGENSYEAIIGNQEGDFKAAMSPIKTTPATAGHGGYSTSGVQLMKFYMAHSDVFKDDQAAAKNAVSIEWKNKIKYNK